ncbi:hypothetical protein EVA_20295 [gut metagenome]|uniref:Uncharacterized protein n=1 Tax=gut metagenome TaxID=749906 RepID=J9FW92_9ZZZZ
MVSISSHLSSFSAFSSGTKGLADIPPSIGVSSLSRWKKTFSYPSASSIGQVEILLLSPRNF